VVGTDQCDYEIERCIMDDIETDVYEVVIVEPTATDAPSDTVGGVDTRDEETVGGDDVAMIDAVGGGDVVDRESVGGNDDDDEEEEDDDMGGEDKDDPETTGDEN
jgi:hypothetical protein